ncbi:hypothetical protein ACFPYI_04170 [Halomarina salina]|uniref:Uncharacterized protein n=1 Tax=Halomarina salina TaxID=1872699 RepID=A0ABD5RK13_9EURY|nr:hypothetical protein [Halomarina salina]
MTNVYVIDCSECRYERRIEGAESALRTADAHQAEAGPHHTVDVVLEERRPSDAS